jgi:signal peptidase II
MPPEREAAVIRNPRTVDRGLRAAPRSSGAGRRIAPFAAVALAVTAVDQGTKVLIRSGLAEGETWPGRNEIIRLSHVENSGAAFGILQGAAPLLLVMTVIGVVAVAVYMIVAPPGRRLYAVALAMVLGGAVGNLIDRATRGTVTDFIDPAHYPAFNIADSAIVVGAIVLVWLTFADGGDGAGESDTADGARERDGGG